MVDVTWSDEEQEDAYPLEEEEKKELSWNCIAFTVLSFVGLDSNIDEYKSTNDFELRHIQ